MRKTAQIMRDKHADAYEALSDSVALELNLADQSIDPKCLGKVDTFRFEEAALLTMAGELIRQGQYDDALLLVYDPIDLQCTWPAHFYRSLEARKTKDSYS